MKNKIKIITYLISVTFIDEIGVEVESKDIDVQIRFSICNAPKDIYDHNDAIDDYLFDKYPHKDCTFEIKECTWIIEELS